MLDDAIRGERMKTLGEAIEEELLKQREAGVFTAASCAQSAIEALALEDPGEWAIQRDQIVLDSATVAAQRSIQRALRQTAKTDPRQGYLDFPGYERIPQLIEIEGAVVELERATLKQYRESNAALATRIRSYAYPRRSDAKLKRDKAQLTQRRKLDRRVSPLMAGYPEMTMGPAIKMYRESPSIEQRRKAIKSRWDREKVRT
jgi:hypothetical protein